MAKACLLCSEKIEENELNKLEGTIVKHKNSENINEFYYICKACQKRHRHNLKDAVRHALEKKE